MNELRKPSLSNFWLDALSRRMDKAFPDIIGQGQLIDCWKVDGWNDGTTTLFGVYEINGRYHQCVFPDYGEPAKTHVLPRFVHDGWDEEQNKNKT